MILRFGLVCVVLISVQVRASSCISALISRVETDGTFSDLSSAQKKVEMLRVLHSVGPELVGTHVGQPNFSERLYAEMLRRYDAAFEASEDRTASTEVRNAQKAAALAVIEFVGEHLNDITSLKECGLLAGYRKAKELCRADIAAMAGAAGFWRLSHAYYFFVSRSLAEELANERADGIETSMPLKIAAAVGQVELSNRVIDALTTQGFPLDVFRGEPTQLSGSLFSALDRYEMTNLLRKMDSLLSSAELPETHRRNLDYVTTLWTVFDIPGPRALYFYVASLTRWLERVQVSTDR